MPRDGAGKIDLMGGTGPIKHMIGLPTFMEFFKMDTTFQGQSPDCIDPERTKPDVPWTWQISDDAGYSNEIVARVFIQCAEALNNKLLKRGDGNKIRLVLNTCKEDLRNCEKAFLRLKNNSDEIALQIKKAGGVKAEKGVVNNLPQIPNLEHDVTLFLTCSKRALQSIADILNEFYGISINNARFDKGITQLKKLNPVPKYLLDSLNKFSALIKRVLDLRNFQDHTPKKTIVRNFHITASALLPPMWQVFPEPEKPIIPEMHALLSSLIEMAEILFFESLLDNLGGSFATTYYVIEIPIAERKDGSAIRFRCESKLFQQTTSGTSKKP